MGRAHRQKVHKKRGGVHRARVQSANDQKKKKKASFHLRRWQNAWGSHELEGVSCGAEGSRFFWLVFVGRSPCDGVFVRKGSKKTWLFF